MNLNRRSFFGVIPTIPAVALAAKTPTVKPAELNSGFAIARKAKREDEIIYLAFLRLGLLAPGERVAEADYDLALMKMCDYPNWTDTDLAFALWPHYSNVFRSYPPTQGFAAQK